MNKNSVGATEVVDTTALILKINESKAKKYAESNRRTGLLVEFERMLQEAELSQEFWYMDPQYNQIRSEMDCHPCPFIGWAKHEDHFRLLYQVIRLDYEPQNAGFPGYDDNGYIETVVQSCPVAEAKADIRYRMFELIDAFKDVIFQGLSDL